MFFLKSSKPPDLLLYFRRIKRSCNTGKKAANRIHFMRRGASWPILLFSECSLIIVLNDEIARKIFGNQPALHKVIHISSSTNGDHDFLVTGVFKPFDKPSHIDARFFMSMGGGKIADYIKQQEGDLATNNLYYTY